MRSENHLYQYGKFYPHLAESVYVAPGAKIIGRVEIGEGSSVWYNTVIRADADGVKIGRETNIQDGCTLHEDEGFPLVIGNRVSVGHNVVLHGCTIGDGALVGMGAIVLNGARVGDGAVVGAGALLTQGQEIPAGHLAMGSPAKVVRELSPGEIEGFGQMALRYFRRAKFCVNAGPSPDALQE
jgi:Carbonic anhydrases/acetyltransferases, isoleucine patch superfamily